MTIRNRTPHITLSRRKIHELKRAMRDDQDIAHERSWLAENPKDQVVYFVQIADEPDSPIKIGYTTEFSLEDRLCGLQVGCPYRLRILATMRGGPDEEGRLHESFAHAHVRGEWFNPTPGLLALIDGLPNCVRSEPPLDLPEETG